MNELEEFLHFTAKFLRPNKSYGLVPIVRNDRQIIINPDGIKPGAIIRNEEEFLALKNIKKSFFLILLNIHVERIITIIFIFYLKMRLMMI